MVCLFPQYSYRFLAPKIRSLLALEMLAVNQGVNGITAAPARHLADAKAHPGSSRLPALARSHRS